MNTNKNINEIISIIDSINNLSTDASFFIDDGQNGSGQKFYDFNSFLKELCLMAKDAMDNGATYFDITLDTDGSPYYNEDNDEE